MRSLGFAPRTRPSQGRVIATSPRALEYRMKDLHPGLRLIKYLAYKALSFYVRFKM